MLSQQDKYHDLEEGKISNFITLNNIPSNIFTHEYQLCDW